MPVAEYVALWQHLLCNACCLSDCDYKPDPHPHLSQKTFRKTAIKEEPAKIDSYPAIQHSIGGTRGEKNTKKSRSNWHHQINCHQGKTKSRRLSKFTCDRQRPPREITSRQRSSDQLIHDGNLLGNRPAHC